MTTTPTSITPAIRKLCAKIGSDCEPVFVPVRAEAGARRDYCYQNVEAKVTSSSGEVQHGWIIWETPGLLVEGEFHACWVSPEGELLDVSPKPDGETTILFLPDKARKWEGKFIGNVRLPLVDNAHIRGVIAENERLERLRQKYWCGDHAEIPLDELQGRAEPEGPVRVKKVGRNEPCPCGSGRKFKKCHGAIAH